MNKNFDVPLRTRRAAGDTAAAAAAAAADSSRSSSSSDCVGSTRAPTLRQFSARRELIIEAQGEGCVKMASFDADAALRLEEQYEKTPVFSYSAADFSWELGTAGPCFTPENAFEKQVQQRYDNAKKEKAFNYELNLLYKILPGNYALTCQLNVERGQHRRKPHPHRKMNDLFDNRRFNFTKIKQKEILLDLRCTDTPLTPDPLDRHLLLVNASPVERCHCLVVPCIQKCHAQVLTEAAVRLGTHLMLLSKSPNFHVLFNSLLALASINHLHLHIFFWPYVCEITRKQPEHIRGPLYVLRLSQWFVHAFVFQLSGPDDMEAFINSVYGTAEYLQENEVPHNLLMCRAPLILPHQKGDHDEKSAEKKEVPLFVTVYIYPRKPVYGKKPVTNFHPAGMELSGMLLVYTLRFFQSAAENSCIRVIEDEARITDEQFEELIMGLEKKLSGDEEEESN